MELNTVKSSGTWGQTATTINENFSKTNSEIEKLKASLILFKGFFLTNISLMAAVPSPIVGDYAYVGATYPGVVYSCTSAGTWYNTGRAPTTEPINLSDYAKLTDVDDAIEMEVVDRNEAISAETVARQNDFDSVKIALRGAVSASDSALNMTNSFSDKLEGVLLTKESGFYIVDVQGYIGVYISPSGNEFGNNIDIEKVSDIEYDIQSKL